jgi:hypothetical protein
MLFCREELESGRRIGDDAYFYSEAQRSEKSWIAARLRNRETRIEV